MSLNWSEKLIVTGSSATKPNGRSWEEIVPDPEPNRVRVAAT